MNLHELIFAANVEALENVLRMNPSLASQEIPLRDNPATAHPLHRICDGVCLKYYTEQEGIEMAKILIRYGADVNVKKNVGEDSPLTAACSMWCDELALFYLEQGASIHHQGCHGGTALHWSAWCGRDRVLQTVLEMNPNINQLCIKFKSTPLFWALHGYRFGGVENRHHQINCARLLLSHGADRSIPNFEGYVPQQLIEEGNTELEKLFQQREA
jgi:uncharacterized protein